jgi:hypothetical protein
MNAKIHFTPRVTPFSLMFGRNPFFQGEGAKISSIPLEKLQTRMVEF